MVDGAGQPLAGAAVRAELFFYLSQGPFGRTAIRHDAPTYRPGSSNHYPLAP